MSILDAPGITQRRADSRYGLTLLKTRLSLRPNNISLLTATLGNSIVQGVSGISFTDQAIWSSGAQLTFLKNSGIAGNTSAMMLARMDADVPAGTEVCLIMEGSNDATNTNLFGHRTNMESIIAKLLARNITPVLIATAPFTDRAPTIAGYHAAEHALAQKYNIAIVDPWLKVLDQRTGNWGAGNTTDSVHPTFPAALIAKDDLARFLKGEVSPPDFAPRSNIKGVDGYTISGGNCFMMTDTNADGVPDGWQLAGTALGSLVDAPAGFRGKFARITSQAKTGNPYLTKRITSGWNAGDELMISWAMQINAGPELQQAFVTITSDGVQQTNILGMTSPIEPQRRYFKLKPKTLNPIDFFCRINGQGSGSFISIGEFEIYNLTALLSR